MNPGGGEQRTLRPPPPASACRALELLWTPKALQSPAIFALVRCIPQGLQCCSPRTLVGISRRAGLLPRPTMHGRVPRPRLDYRGLPVRRSDSTSDPGSTTAPASCPPAQSCLAGTPLRGDVPAHATHHSPATVGKPPCSPAPLDLDGTPAGSSTPHRARCSADGPPVLGDAQYE